jgi:stage V sporulation protein B
MVSKDSLIKGTIILTAAAFVARFLGVIQRVPLQHMLDNAGMATYGIAYNLYFVLLIVATAGIPSALSKLISERKALGQHEEAARIYSAAVWFAIGAGALITVLLYVAAPYYAVYVSQDKDAALAIRALAPAMLLFPLIAIMRGYFQGRQMMAAGGLSQVVEQILRVITAVGLAFILLYLGYSREAAVAGASFGGVMGAVGAFAVMVYFYRKLKKRDQLEAEGITETRVEVERRRQAVQSGKVSLKQIYRLIFKLSIPISLISIAVPMIYFIDSSIVIGLIKEQIGMAQAKVQLGLLTGKAQSLAGIPPILAIALSMSVVPIVSSAYARKDMNEVAAQSSQALRISILSGLPLVLVLSVAARPTNGFLFSDAEGTAIIVLMTVGAMFQILMMTSGAILMGLGQTRRPMIHVFIGIAVKLAFSFILAQWLGIYGIIIATSLCFIVIMMMNLSFLKKTVQYQLLGSKKWIGLSAATMLLVIIGTGLEWVSHHYIHLFGLKFSYGLRAFLVASIVLVLYPVMLMKFRVVTAGDVERMPASVQKLIRRISQVLNRFLKRGRVRNHREG